jgi:hypothetical protein
MHGTGAESGYNVRGRTLEAYSHAAVSPDLQAARKNLVCIAISLGLTLAFSVVSGFGLVTMARDIIEE